MTGWWRSMCNRNPGGTFVRWMAWEVTRTCAWLYLVLTSRLRMYGSRNIPESGSVLLLCNHQSYLDLLMLGASISHRHFHGMARKTLFRHPLFGAYIRALNAFEVDQEKGDIRAIRTAIEQLKAGHLVLVFPEGSRTSDGRVQAFQEGVMLVLRRAKPTVVLAAVEGAFDAWPIHGSPSARARTAICFGRPIPANRLLEMESHEALRYLEQQIDAMRLDLRAKLRSQSFGRYPKPGPADGASRSDSEAR